MIQNKKYDIISIGRSGVDLYSDQYGGRLEDTSSFSKYLGGCPANIAIGTSKLGLNSAMFTRVGNEQMGRYMLDTFAKNGVDTQYIVTDKDRLTTLVLLGIQDDETFPLLYYRQHCADMGLCEDDIKEEAIANTQSILISGTHLSTPEISKATFRAVALAKKHKVKVIFDIDYRPTLWGLTDLGGGESRFIASKPVTEQLQKVLPDCDMIVGTEEEFNIAGGSEEWRESLLNIRAMSKAVFIYKLGALGSTVIDAEIPTELTPRGQTFPIQVLNSVGAGDAFMSGFLSGYLRGKDWDECATRGNASGALVVTRHSCSPASPSLPEIEYFIKNYKQLPKVPDQDPYFKHLHYSTCRPYEWNNLHILAFDHRIQMEVIADESGYTGKKAEKATGKIRQVKELVYNAFEQVRAQYADKHDMQFGLICDDRYGKEVLEKASISYNPAMQGQNRLPLWSARPVEKPLSRPLEFDTGGNIGSVDNKHPVDLAVAMKNFAERQTLKCLVFHHPDDDQELQEEQMRRLNRLYQLAQANRLELLVEILPPSPKVTGMLTAQQVADSIELAYKNEIFPDWWKLASFATQEEWDLVSNTINKNDEYCRGILLLGAEKPLDELGAQFTLAAKQSLCKGYAIGRSIWAAPSRDWLAGKLDDAEAVKQLTDNFTTIINSWEESRGAS